MAAVLVALGLAMWEAISHRKTRAELEILKADEATRYEEQQAGLVSAWVESVYEVSSDASHYEQRAMVHVANEGAEPVFNVHVLIGIGRPVVQLGPLSVPVPIPVMPPRRVRSWDISLPLMAHSAPVSSMPGEPVARIHFSNATGARWHRDYEGVLHRSTGESAQLFEHDVDEGERQLGDLGSPFNPMQVAYTLFGAAVEDTPPPANDVRVLFASTAPGWGQFDEADWKRLRDMVAGYGLAAHVHYPAPRVAYVRLVHEDDAKREVLEAGFVSVRALVVTLVFLPSGRVGESSASERARRSLTGLAFPPGALLKACGAERRGLVARV